MIIIFTYIVRVLFFLPTFHDPRYVVWIISLNYSWWIPKEFWCHLQNSDRKSWKTQNNYHQHLYINHICRGHQFNGSSLGCFFSNFSGFEFCRWQRNSSRIPQEFRSENNNNLNLHRKSLVLFARVSWPSLRSLNNLASLFWISCYSGYVYLWHHQSENRKHYRLFLMRLMSCVVM